MQLEGGEDGGVVTGDDVVRAAIGRVDDAAAWIRAPQHAVTVRRHVDTDLHTQIWQCTEQVYYLSILSKYTEQVYIHILSKYIEQV